MGIPNKPRTFQKQEPANEKELEGIRKALSAMAYPIQVMTKQGSEIGLGMNKFEYYSSLMLSHMVSRQNFHCDDQEMLVMARNAVRATKALFTAQLEAFKEQQALLKQGEESETR